MNPTIAQYLVKAHHADLEAEAANSRLVAEARAARKLEPSTDAATGGWRLIALVAGLVASLIAAVAR